MRIALVAACPFPAPRGTPVRIHRMAEALARRGHDVHVVAYHLGTELIDPPFTLHRIPDVPSYRHMAPGPTVRKLTKLNGMLRKKLAEVLEEYDIELIHAHHYEGILVASPVAGHRPLIYDAHTTLASELPSYSLCLPGFVKFWVGGFLDRRLPRRARHTIAVSNVIREQLIAIGAVKREAVSVVGNGVRAEMFEVDEGLRWRPAPTTKTIVYAGNVAPYQGMGLLLQAFVKVHAARPDARLLIVTPEDLGSFETDARELGVWDAIVHARAPFAELPAHLAGADIAVNPRPVADGLPHKLLNYMAAGLPIVTFAGSAAHLVHERTCLSVEGTDPADFAAALLRLLDDPALARRLGDAVRREVREEHTWDSAAAKIERIYASLI